MPRAIGVWVKFLENHWAGRSVEGKRAKEIGEEKSATRKIPRVAKSPGVATPGLEGMLPTAHKNAPRKAYVPGGQRTRKPFRERLDAMTLACGRTSECVTFAGRGVCRSGAPASVPKRTAPGSNLVAADHACLTSTHPNGLLFDVCELTSNVRRENTAV